LAGILLAFAAGGGLLIAVSQVSADKSPPTEPTPTTSTVLTSTSKDEPSTVKTDDSEDELIVTTIDEHTIEISRPD
jgi:hypothetical protein